MSIVKQACLISRMRHLSKARWQNLMISFQNLIKKFPESQLTVTKKKIRTTNQRRLPVKGQGKQKSLQENEYYLTMRLGKIEQEFKQKKVEMGSRHLEQECGLKLEYRNFAFDAKCSGSDEGAALSIRSRSPFNWKRQRRDIFVKF